MSVLHQQRLRVARNSTGRYAPHLLWEVTCPCCQWGLAVDSWDLAFGYAHDHLTTHHCRYCIDRQMPAGTDSVLGELYERCPVCTPVCACCDGIAVYPALVNTPTELVTALTTVRLAPIFCDDCAGVVAVVPLDPEVSA